MGKVGLIVAREFNERVRKKSFIITTILTPLLMVGIIAAVAWISSSGSREHKNIIVVDDSGVVAQSLKSHDKITYTVAQTPLDSVKHHHADDTWGILVIGRDVMTNGNDVQLYTFSSSTMDTETAISKDIESVVETEKLKAYSIDNLPQIMAEVKTDVGIQAIKIDDDGTESNSSSALSFAIAYMFGFLMYMFVLIYGSQVMTGVVEEKTNKVLEVMVSSVRPFQLMMGKILGVATVAITQFAIWIVVTVVLGSACIHLLVPDDLMAAASAMNAGADVSTLSGTVDNPEALAAMAGILNPTYLARLLVGFFVFFVGGYLLYAAMFAAVGSAVDNLNDSNQFQTLITLPIMLALVVMFSAMNDPNGPLAVWFSMIPFTSPIVMVARIPYGVPIWEIGVSALLLFATFFVMVWLAGKIYRVGIFMYGKKPSFKELYKWMTYKY